MVFTHIPASLLLIGMTLVPWAGVAAVLYLARAFVSSMDVPTRQSYTMAIVDPDERTATAGLTSVVRSISQSVGPLLAAALVSFPMGLSAPLIACAGLKISLRRGALLRLPEPPRAGRGPTDCRRLTADQPRASPAPEAVRPTAAG